MSYISDLRKYVGHSPILTAGAVLFIFKDSKLLMQLRSDYNAWGLIGGSLELGETLEETAIRELKEETNLDVDELKFVRILSGKNTYREYPNGDKLYDITAIYTVTKYHGDLKINDNESKELKWFDINNLPDNLAPITVNYLTKFNNLLQDAYDKYKNVDN